MLKQQPRFESAASDAGAKLWKVVAVAVLGPFLTSMDSTVVNVSLSSLARELHSSLADIQWVTSGYLLSLALMLPLSGWLVDRIGARNLYLICFSSFTAASVLCGLAWSTKSLVTFRVLQGIVGGLLAPMAQMMIARAAGRHLARVMGYAVLPILIGPILGPVLAGSILRHASWRWLFYINLPIGVLAVILALFWLPDEREQANRRTFNLAGFAMLSPGLVLFLFGLEHVGQRTGQFSLGVAVVLLAAFVVYARRRGGHALIDIRLFSRPVFSAAASTQFLSNGAVFAGQMLVPFYLMNACHFSPTRAGWLLAPLGLGMLCSYPLMGTLTEHFGVRRVSATGAFLALAGTFPFAYMAQHRLMIPVLAVALFVRGAGLGSINIPSISAAYASVAKKDLPMATTAINIVQRLGGPVMTTVVAIFLEWKLMPDRQQGAVLQPFAAAFWLLSGIHGLAFLASMRLPAFIVHRSEREENAESQTVEALAE